jgi:CDP-paratose 2-epimerase
MVTRYTDDNRIGDHIWWVSSVEKFKAHYPGWSLTYNVPAILEEIFRASACS